MFSCFQNFTNEDIIRILKEEGLETKIERGNRVFPVTDNAQSVIDALQRRLRRLNVKIITNANVIDILVEEGKAIGAKYLFEDQTKIIRADKIILAVRRCKLY